MTHLRDLWSRFPIPAQVDASGEAVGGPAFYYDPMLFHLQAQELAGEGLNLIRFRQNDSDRVPADSHLYGQVVQKVIAHEDDPVLRSHVLSAVARPKEGGGFRLDKPKGSKKKIDACIAMSMAVFGTSLPAPPPPVKPRSSVIYGF